MLLDDKEHAVTAQISRIAFESQHYGPLMFTPALMNIGSIRPNLDTPMDITDLLKIECVYSRLSPGATCVLSQPARRPHYSEDF